MKLSQRALSVSAVILCLTTIGCGNGASNNAPRQQQPAPIQQQPSVDLRPVQTAAQAAQAAAERAATAAAAAQAAAEQARDARQQSSGNPACDPHQPAFHTADADCDGDEIPNRLDVCPAIKASDNEHDADRDPRRRGCPAPDTDGDGVSDAWDQCVNTPHGDHEHHERSGCPDTDGDGDGVFDHSENNRDQCPNLAAGQNPDPAHSGCPQGTTAAQRAIDNDGDGLRDEEDPCPHEAPGDSPDPTRAGCPDGDDDRDGVLNHAPDYCPRTAVQHDGTTATAPVANPDWPGCPEHQDHDANATPTPAPAPTTEPTAAPAPVPAPTAVAPVATLPENMVATRRVMTTLGDRAAVIARLCAPRSSEQLMAATGACAPNEAYCFRLVPNAAVGACNPTAMTPGCVMASGTIDPCVDGAERVVAIQCGSSLIGCTPENVATVAAREGERPSRERTASRGRRHRHGIFVGLNGISWR